MKCRETTIEIEGPACFSIGLNRPSMAQTLKNKNKKKEEEKKEKEKVKVMNF
jgi:hypothetical protein